LEEERFPELMKGLGQGIREFKKASELKDEPEKKEPVSNDLEVKVQEKK